MILPQHEVSNFLKISVRQFYRKKITLEPATCRYSVETFS